MIDESIFDHRWTDQLTRDAEGAPLLPPLFVLGLPETVRLVDLRTQEEATGPAGHIPGSASLTAEALKSIPRETPIVLVSRLGEDAARTAKRMEDEGWSRVAALNGGVAAWRDSGFGTSRNSEGLSDALRPGTRVSPGPLTLERIRQHIGHPRAVRWVKLVSLIGQSLCSCIDGRDGRGVIGTPGGDAGEFVLFLAAREQVFGTRLGRSDVYDALLERLDSFGGFYLHTDADALETLAATLRSDPVFAQAVAGFDTSKQWIDFLLAPPEAVREPLLDHLANPAHIGCGHLRLMVQHPEEYGLRPELATDTIHASFQLLWEGAPEMHVTALPGGHEEAAVLSVRLDGEVWDLSRIPLVSPSCGGQQMFVNHPDVASRIRRGLVRSIGGGPDLQRAVDELGDRQMSATLGHLAEGLPIFEAVFGANGTFEVQEAS